MTSLTLFIFFEQITLPELCIQPNGMLELKLDIQMDPSLHLTDEAPSAAQLMYTGMF